MAEETKVNDNTVNTQPEGNGTEKTFTQDEVNRIVSERLARERAKSEPTPDEKRESELNARENKMNCKEYLIDHKYPADLLEVFNTDNAEEFKANTEKLLKLFPAIIEPIYNPVRSTANSTVNTDSFADIFKPKI